MCCFKSLVNNRHGYVVRCNGCSQLHIAFGNTLLAFTTDEFYTFVDTVADSYQTGKYYHDRDVKHIQIATAARSVILVYSTNELEAFLNLLNAAKKAICMESLFIFNNN